MGCALPTPVRLRLAPILPHRPEQWYGQKNTRPAQCPASPRSSNPRYAVAPGMQVLTGLVYERNRCASPPAAGTPYRAPSNSLTSAGYRPGVPLQLNPTDTL